MLNHNADYNVSLLNPYFFPLHVVPCLSVLPFCLSVPVCCVREFSESKGSPVGPYLTCGTGGGITGLSSLNLTPLLITCWISLLAPGGVLS